jgi:hypothetical protein
VFRVPPTSKNQSVPHHKHPHLSVVKLLKSICLVAGEGFEPSTFGL